MGIWDDFTRREGLRKLRRALFGNGEMGMTPEVPADFVPPEGHVALVHEGEVPEGSFMHVTAQGWDIALGRVEGELVALSNNCPHAGGPMHKGKLRGSFLTCPWHGWCFDVKTGASITIRGQMLPRFEIHLKDGVVCLRVDELEELRA